jgi:hypothetical protein
MRRGIHVQSQTNYRPTDCRICSPNDYRHEPGQRHGRPYWKHWDAAILAAGAQRRYTNSHADCIQNTGGQSQDMTGWTLVSVVGPQTFNCPNGFTLGAGASVPVESYTDSGNNPPSVLFWATDPVWNNAGDKAELRDNTNALIDNRCHGNACP